jgi:hypothetical protein
MNRFKKDNYPTGNKDNKALEISIEVRNNSVSNKRIIQLVKLMARQAAEEDYAQSLLQSD